MLHGHHVDRNRQRRRTRTTVVVLGVATLVLGVSAPAPVAQAAPAVTPAATATFATWTGTMGDNAYGTLGSVGVEVGFTGPDGSLPAWGPAIVSQDLSNPGSYNPAGGPTQDTIDYSGRPGSVTINFDAPVTNLAIYTYAFRGPFGPEAYALNATGSGDWVRVSGNGELAGSVLLSDTMSFINGVFVFAGTLTELEIETLGDFDCCGSQAFTLATLDTVTYPAPTITGVAPASGPVGGGTTLTVTGSGFFEGIAVAVGDGECSDIAFDSETQLTCVTPPGEPGPVDMGVATPGGIDILLDAFTYVVSPDPAPGPAPGPEPVTPRFTG